jgi:hypothetical protein
LKPLATNSFAVFEKAFAGMKNSSVEARFVRSSVAGAFVAIALASVVPAAAIVIETRATLLAQLGTAAVTEDFEGYQFPTNSAEKISTELDATTVIGAQGPALVKPGVRFIQSPPYEGLQWDRQFEYGLTSAALVSDTKLIVDFMVPVNHVGLDLFWYWAMNPPWHPSTIQVYAADDSTLLYSADVRDPDPANPYFFGFSDSRGIGKIVMFRQEGSSLGVSPMIDNLTFGFVPSLSIALNGQQVAVSWLQETNAWQLESTMNLTAQNGWTAVTNEPVVSGGQCVVALPVTEANVFFRLHGK